MRKQMQEKPKTKKRSWRAIMDRSNTSKSSSRSTRSSGQRSSASEEDVSKSWTSSSSDLSGSLSQTSSNTELTTGIYSSKFLTSTPRETDRKKRLVEIKDVTQLHMETQRAKNNKGRPNFVNVQATKRDLRPSSVYGRLPFAAVENRICKDTGIPPVKKQKTVDGFRTTQSDVKLGDGIITRRRLPKVNLL